MAEQSTRNARIEALRRHGDARNAASWQDGTLDYVAKYLLTEQDIPALVSLATQRVDAPSDDVTVYGPVHAWRALAQMRAIEAVQPLLDVQDQLDELGDDWYLEEFHHVFGMIGTPAIQPLEAYLSDDSHAEFPLIKAANGLREVARHFPDTREQVIAILTRELARHRKDYVELNGHLMSDLLDLEAVSSAEVIERAFAANVIDPIVAGDWGDARRKLGLPGLGIAPDHSPRWPTIRERMGLADPAAEQRRSAVQRKKRQTELRQAKARRKQERRSRKRNRKPR